MKDREPISIHCFVANRFSIGDKLGLVLESEVRKLEAYTTELEQRIEAMKCCGNWQIKEGE